VKRLCTIKQSRNLSLAKIRYREDMADTQPDLFVSQEAEIEVDAATAAAIQRGIQAADDGQVVSSEEARKHVRRLISKLSTPAQR
jgi:predicted transcriptional regulator